MSEIVQLHRLSEAALVQNEALGAYALWKFALGYQDRDGHAATLPLAFLVLPLILYSPTLEMVLRTQKGSGLHLFAGKLGDQREDLLAIHGRALSLRRLTVDSLMSAEQSSLVRIDPTTATMWANGPYEDLRAPVLPERIRRLGLASERIGYWFSGLTDQQV
ncbi:three component ABC system middle component [Burkholderia sp. BCC0405]|uniref:three component ABC system middle component n=1 Tax=Burkholderia sp. BCC0405 TaxID=2676298 RepID=UPI00158C626C|nr:three component ABC system middle component [Burkholderia sp. BCC0405]